LIDVISITRAVEVGMVASQEGGVFHRQESSSTLLLQVLVQHLQSVVRYY
jgi:hypothetical protein